MSSEFDKARFMVHWPARTLTTKRELNDAIVCEIAKGELSLEHPHSLAIGAQLNIEFHVNFRKKKHRIRAKTKVTYCQLHSNNHGALIDLKITECNSEDIHTLNNILMTFYESKEVDLRINRAAR